MVKGGHAWQRGVACMAKGGQRAWQRRGMHGKGGVVCGEGGHAWHAPPHEIRPVIARAVRILLECILVLSFAGPIFPCVEYQISSNTVSIGSCEFSLLILTCNGNVSLYALTAHVWPAHAICC